MPHKPIPRLDFNRPRSPKSASIAQAPTTQSQQEQVEINIPQIREWGGEAYLETLREKLTDKRIRLSGYTPKQIGAVGNFISIAKITGGDLVLKTSGGNAVINLNRQGTSLNVTILGPALVIQEKDSSSTNSTTISEATTTPTKEVKLGAEIKIGPDEIPYCDATVSQLKTKIGKFFKVQKSDHHGYLRDHLDKALLKEISLTGISGNKSRDLVLRFQVFDRDGKPLSRLEPITVSGILSSNYDKRDPVSVGLQEILEDETSSANPTHPPVATALAAAPIAKQPIVLAQEGSILKKVTINDANHLLNDETTYQLIRSNFLNQDIVITFRGGHQMPVNVFDMTHDGIMNIYHDTFRWSDIQSIELAKPALLSAKQNTTSDPIHLRWLDDRKTFEQNCLALQTLIDQTVTIGTSSGENFKKVLKGIEIQSSGPNSWVTLKFTDGTTFLTGQVLSTLENFRRNITVSAGDRSST